MSVNYRLKFKRFLVFSALLILMMSTTFLTIPVEGLPTGWTRLPSKTAEPGDLVYFDIEIKSWFDVIYNLTVTDLPNGWTTHFENTNDEITQIAIKTGETV